MKRRFRRGALFFSLAIAGVVFACNPAQSLAAFPGSNGRIAYRSGSSDVFGDIYTANPDGSDVQRLTVADYFRGPCSEDPSWSPDGSKIVHWRGCTHRSPPEGIWVMDADGRNGTVLVQDIFYPDTFFNEFTGPTWSPDGRRIVFARTLVSGDVGARTHNTELFVMNADGSRQERITDNPAIDHEPAWSPDGQTIAFVRSDPQLFPYPSDIYAISPDGSGLRKLTESGRALSPNWSPDGSRIAFSERPDQVRDIYTMNADGTDVQQVTGGDQFSADPAWSPDGSRIAFSRNGDIFTIKSDGTELQRVAATFLNEYAPDWQPLNAPPDCSEAQPSVGSLWPPDRRFQVVTVTGVRDPEGQAVTVVIGGVTQDEPTSGSGDSGPDAQLGSAPGAITLRRERGQRGDGRVYHVFFTASDGLGACQGEVAVEVQRYFGTPAVDSSPPEFDSFAP